MKLDEFQKQHPENIVDNKFVNWKSSEKAKKAEKLVDGIFGDKKEEG